MKNPTSSRDSDKVATCAYIHKSLLVVVIITLYLSGTVESASQVRGRALGIGYGGWIENDPTDVPSFSTRMADSISNDDPDEDVSVVPDGRAEDVASISKTSKGSKKSKSTKSETKLRKNDVNGSEEDVDGRVDDGITDSEPTEEPTISVTASYSSSSPSVVNSSNPTLSPATEPSGLPTGSPTVAPTGAPTMAPSTDSPTSAPTAAPTSAPTETPSGLPTPVPTRGPTGSPTSIPSTAPSAAPSKLLKTAKSLELVGRQKLHDNQKQTKAPVLM